MAVIKKFRIKSFKNHKEVIKLENISLSYGKRKILDNINISINSGEIAGLLGPNGVGKSTIFNLITGLLKPNFGSIKINSKTVNNYPIYLKPTKTISNLAGFSWPDEVRDEVLARLLALNAERYEEEVAAGLHKKNQPKAKATNKTAEMAMMNSSLFMIRTFRVIVLMCV